MPSRRARLCAAFFAVYTLGSLAVGERLPFSLFTMYSCSRDVKESIVFFADGKPAELFDYTDFDLDGDPTSSAPRDSEHLLADEIAAYVRGHRAIPGARGDSRVRFAVVRTSWNPATDEVTNTLRVICSGTARRGK